MSALPTRATIHINNSQSSSPSSASSSSSNSNSSSPSTTPSSTSSTTSRLRSFFGIKPSSPSSISSTLGDLPPSTFPQYGHLGPHLVVDSHPTPTSDEQLQTEARIDQLVNDWKHPTPSYSPQPSLVLLRDLHIQYLLRSIDLLPSGYSSLDASRPWLIYWTLNSLSALHYTLPTPLAHRCLSFLSLCQHPTGGYAGGPSQHPHLAPTYATLNSLALLSSIDTIGLTAFSQINRHTLYTFLLRMKQPDGSFSVCDDGECDTRGVYCAISVATQCGLLTDALIHNTVDYLQRCQTYEGGMGGEPGNEAHGGYTFCSVAALVMMGSGRAVRLEGVRSVRQWAARRQMRREGGFCGRTNKLVDGCYSFWVGALFPLLEWMREGRVGEGVGVGWDDLALQRYVLLAGQSAQGGLRDKPGKGPDLYHTCYCLSGLSIGQWGGRVLGVDSNRVRKMNPLYNIPIEDAERALEWSSTLPKPDSTWS